MKNQSNTSMGNPAAAVALTQYAANNPKAVKKAVNIGLVLGTISIVSVSGIVFYHLYWKHRFRSIKENNQYAPAKISDSQAKLRAKRIYDAMYGIGSGFSTVYQAMVGLNHNDFIRLYNAFGKRRPATSFGFGNSGDLTLTEWFADQFNDNELNKLRYLVNANGLF